MLTMTPRNAKRPGPSGLGLLILVVLTLLAAGIMAQDASPASREKQVVEWLTLSADFKTLQPALSTITGHAPRAAFTVPQGSTNSFTLRFKVKLSQFAGEKTILEIPQVVRVGLRQHDPRDRKRQNYPALKMPDGSVPVLEAHLALHSTEHPDWTNMTIGIPLAMLPQPQGEHDMVLSFSGVDWKLYADGELLDDDFPFGYPQWAEHNTWNLDSQHVTSAALYLPAIQPEKRVSRQTNTSPGIQYWVPRGHNNWVGDVQTFFYQGRYHLFYLRDRRHGQSKFGCGGHYFEHLSTRDFKTWTEHEAATPLEGQWECIGTGIPFALNGQLCLAYGLHTTRIYPEEKTTLPAQREYLKQHGKTGTFKSDLTLGVPAGATYAVSADGITDFRKSRITFHTCENPSVYADPSGKLRLLANFHSKGTWESESVDGGWRCVNANWPRGSSCTIWFRWGEFDYVMGGFVQLWSKPAGAPDSAYQDVVRQGLDFYDGSNVPSVTQIPGGRFLMAAFIPIGFYAGPLVIHELLQFPDGRIGSKWMKEITPATEPPTTLAERITDTATFPAKTRSFLLTFDIAEATKGKLGISFLPKNGEAAACELQISLDERRAQFAPGSLSQFAPRQKTLREGGAPRNAGNYAIENLIDTNKPFTVRVMVHSTDKLGGSLIDAEIAGQRTLISYRPELTVGSLAFRSEAAELKKIQIAAVRSE